MNTVNMDSTWRSALAEEFDTPYFSSLNTFVTKERHEFSVFPPKADMFNALQETPLQSVKVVILGQDPYHDEGQAHGMAFSVRPGVATPPSLRNIFKELATDIPGFTIPQTGFLQPWAAQGVLLLNTVLTVRPHQAGSHRGKGWEQFTDRIISLVVEKKDPVVFILWGNDARKKKELLTKVGGPETPHFVIESTHPSPLSAHNGFFGSKPFSRTNTFLTENGHQPINWQL
jgi:uracil-DNA glycosylase